MTHMECENSSAGYGSEIESERTLHGAHLVATTFHCHDIERTHLGTMNAMQTTTLPPLRHLTQMSSSGNPASTACPDVYRCSLNNSKVK